MLLAAAEDAVLTTGHRIRALRHEIDGATVKLFTSGGLIEIPTSAVREFEKLELEGFQPNPPGAEPLPSFQAPAAPAPARPPAVIPASNPRQLVQDAAERHGIPPAFLHSVAQAESAYRVNAVSPAGAIGIMQLMPGTAAGLKADPHDPFENVEAGARHLASLLEKYDGSSVKALAAYNAGEGAVARYGGVPPYSETRLYVRKVIDNYRRLSAEKK
jgi:soluble lytic murein transglycosylase-like protein